MSSPRCVTRRKGRTVLNPRRIRKIRRRRRRRRRRRAAASADPSNRRRRHHCWGSTRVFSPLFCVEREERKRVRYSYQNKIFYKKRVVASFFVLFEKERTSLSFQDVAEIQVFGLHHRKQTRQKKHRAYKKCRSGRKGNFKKQKNTNERPSSNTLVCFVYLSCVLFLHSSFNDRIKIQETESGRRA